MFERIGKFIGLGLKLVPYIGVAINAVESLATLIKDLKGSQKKQAVLDAVTRALPIVEDIVNKDLFNDPKVVEAVGNYIDAYVALQNAIAATKAAKGTQAPE